MNPIAIIRRLLSNKWSTKNGEGRTATADEILAAVYDPDTNSLRGGS